MAAASSFLAVHNQATARGSLPCVTVTHQIRSLGIRVEGLEAEVPAHTPHHSMHIVLPLGAFQAGHLQQSKHDRGVVEDRVAATFKGKPMTIPVLHDRGPHGCGERATARFKD